MSNDKIDDLLAIGGAFDWITPLSDVLRGFNTIEYAGDEETCKKLVRDLKKRGIDCRKQWLGENGGSDLYTYRVLSRR